MIMALGEARREARCKPWALGRQDVTMKPWLHTPRAANILTAIGSCDQPSSVHLVSLMLCFLHSAAKAADPAPSPSLLIKSNGRI